MSYIRWFIGTLALALACGLILFQPLPEMIGPGLRFGGFLARGLGVLILAGALCLYRVTRGPTAADRIVAIDIFGILIVGFCAMASVAFDRSWYLDIGIAWALQSFIGSLALSKYLEGTPLDG